MEFTKQMNNWQEMWKLSFFRRRLVYLFFPLLLFAPSVCIKQSPGVFVFVWEPKCGKTIFWVNSPLPITFIQIKVERRFKKTHIHTHMRWCAVPCSAVLPELVNFIFSSPVMRWLYLKCRRGKVISSALPLVYKYYLFFYFQHTMSAMFLDFSREVYNDSKPLIW